MIRTPRSRFPSIAATSWEVFSPCWGARRSRRERSGRSMSGRIRPPHSDWWASSMCSRSSPFRSRPEHSPTGTIGKRLIGRRHRAVSRTQPRARRTRLQWPGAVPALAPLRWCERRLSATRTRSSNATAEPGSLHFDNPALPLDVSAPAAPSACIRILIWPARSSITPLLVPNAAYRQRRSPGTRAPSRSPRSPGPPSGGFLVALTAFPAGLRSRRRPRSSFFS
jgi:hypothetical protein